MRHPKAEQQIIDGAESPAEIHQMTELMYKYCIFGKNREGESKEDLAGLFLWSDTNECDAWVCYFNGESLRDKK